MACFGIDSDKVLVGKSEGKRQLGRPQEDGIRMDFRDWWWVFMNTVMNL
jgi:hypothetical protein